MGVVNNFEFSMISSDGTFNAPAESQPNGIPFRCYKKILLVDSIFSFYPYAEISFKDDAGVIANRLFFSEGLDFNIRMGYKMNEGSPDSACLEHTFVWSQNLYSDTRITDTFVSGINNFILKSQFFQKDLPDSGVFNHENHTEKFTISQIVDKLVKQWGFKDNTAGNNLIDKKIFITPTDGTPFIDRFGRKTKDLIEVLSKGAYSANLDKSPFLTFITCNNEFYFTAIEELFRQASVTTFVLGLKTPQEIEAHIIAENKYYITSYEIFCGGMPVNFNNYRKAFHFHNNMGEPVCGEQHIKEAVLYQQSENDRLLIRGSYIPDNPIENIYLGHINTEEDIEYYKGLINNHYIDSYLSYKIEITAPFDPRITSGKVVEIEIEESGETKERSILYSGKWLVCEVKRSVDDNATYTSKIMLRKPKINIGN